jgi:peroxiredoxin Q/BCP
LGVKNAATQAFKRVKSSYSFAYQGISEGSPQKIEIFEPRLIFLRKEILMKALFLLLACLFAHGAYALKIGDQVPFVQAPWTGSEQFVSPTEFSNKWLIVYFYPKSFTPGCTAEACSLRDAYSEIQKSGATILGVSVDPLKKQQDFKARHQLPFELVSDNQKEWCKAFDALGLGGLVAQRKTFIISPEGKIAYIFEKAGTADHDEEVLGKLRELQGFSS